MMWRAWLWYWLTYAGWQITIMLFAWLTGIWWGWIKR